MLILFDDRMPFVAREKLASIGSAVPFATSGIVYETISGHPDIFFCTTPKKLVVAPNTPKFYLGLLEKFKIDYLIGETIVGMNYPESAKYNALITCDYIMHRVNVTDPIILNETNELKRINVQQAYTRCSSFSINNNLVITSDRGVESTLISQGYNCMFIESENILLSGQKHGFIGGCCGINGKDIVFSGNLDTLKNGENLRKEIIKSGHTITELYDGPLFDGGSILFLHGS